MRLGAEPSSSLRVLDSTFAGDGRALACVIAVHSRMGGDLASMIDGLAVAAEERAQAVAAGRASGAGAVLSGRIVAGLPVFLIPLAPMARSPLLDPLGLVMLMVGAALAVAGMRWVSSLVPIPPVEDHVGVVVADVLSCVLDGGAPLHAALAAVCENAPEDIHPALTTAHRAARLGASWPDALAGTGNVSLQAISSVLRRGVALGAPPSAALKVWSRAQRAAARREFDAALRRAPVLMVVPLSVCVLPAYALLGLGPYLRGLL